MAPFVEKYKPRKIGDLVGQVNAIRKIEELVKEWGKKRKGIFLYGLPGSGKTSAAYVIADCFGYELYEVNASDVRNKEQIEHKIVSVAKQQSLFSKGKIILIDEIDGLSGKEDRGGIQAITKLIGESHFPILLTATNPWDNKFNALRRKCELIGFEPLDCAAVFRILRKICEKEKIKYEESVLKGLARRAGGDARAAINDLQTLTQEKRELTKESLEELAERNRENSIIDALLRIFKTTDVKVAAGAFDNVREDLDEQLLWLDENVPREYTKPADLARAYDKLSIADVFSRRIRRWQHWRFLVYINLLITAGIAVSKDEKYRGVVNYRPTGRLLKMWWAKQKSMRKKSIAAKIAERTHTSTRKALRDSLPYLQIAFKKNKDFRNSLIRELDLSNEEVEWLGK
jgi:replication factor C large subunit